MSSTSWSVSSLLESSIGKICSFKISSLILDSSPIRTKDFNKLSRYSSALEISAIFGADSSLIHCVNSAYRFNDSLCILFLKSFKSKKSTMLIINLFLLLCTKNLLYILQGILQGVFISFAGDLLCLLQEFSYVCCRNSAVGARLVLIHVCSGKFVLLCSCSAVQAAANLSCSARAQPCKQRQMHRIGFRKKFSG